MGRVLEHVRLDASEWLDHLMLDMVWKAVIVGVGIVIVAVAMIVLWKVLGPHR